MSLRNKRIHYRIDLPSVCGKDVKCNLSCPYCHKDFFPVSADFSEGEKKEFADTIAMLEGIFSGSNRKRKIHISGRSEPLFIDEKTFKNEICKIHGRFSDIEIIMTTNGLLLEEKAPLIKESGVTRVNVSVHNGSFRNPKFRKGISSAKNAGLEVVLNSVIDEKVIENSGQLISFASEYCINLKFFSLLNLSREETEKVQNRAISALTSACLNEPLINDDGSRLVFTRESSKIYLKIGNKDETLPEACRKCPLKSACTEGCREAIRITPWYIKPCGIREDNVVFLKNASEAKVKEELIKSGKL